MRMTRRQLALIGAASSLVVVAGTGFVVWRAGILGGADLLQPGPLGEQAIGAGDAPNTIIEYASMTCPHCAAFAINTFPALKKRYIDTGKARFIFREFPLDRLALAAAMLPRCSDDDRFFAMVDLLFKTQRTWLVEEPLAPLLSVAQQEGFTEDRLKGCLANQKILDGIDWVRARATDKFKITSTPTFFINGKMHVGDISIEEIERLMSL